MTDALQAIAGTHDLGQLTHRSIARGAEADRAAAAGWLRRRFGGDVAPGRLIITNGTQSAILMLLRRLVEPGGLLVAERLSYGPLRLLADAAGVRLAGLEIDAEGILPEAFAQACRSLRPRALYCNPTVQNPTTAIMPAERRAAIAAIARRHAVAVIEDDALGRLHEGAPPPIAALAPDVTWYVMTTTKCLSHGLRLAYLVAPSQEVADRVLGPIEHLSWWHPAPLSSAMVTTWIASGAADRITCAIAHECRAREAAARDVLTACAIDSQPGGMHIWLTVPPPWTGHAFAEAAAARGVLLRAADLFAVDEQPIPAAVRVSLSTPATLLDVRRGLGVINAMLA